MKNIVWVIIILVIVGGYFIYQSIVSKDNTSTETIGQQQQGGTQVGQEVPEVREIAVSATEFAFSPSSIQTQAGEKVKIVFTNDGSAPHDFRIEGLNIGTEVIRPGQTDTVEFQAPESGKYTFFCSVPGHREAGMGGNLEVK